MLLNHRLTGLGARASVPKVWVEYMRHAYKFRPEWACGARSFARTIGIVLVALEPGVTAGGAVVLPFVDRPPGQSSMAARPLAAPAVALADKKVTKKHHVATHCAWHGGPLEPLPGEYHMNGI